MNYKDFLDSKYQKRTDCGRPISKADIHPKLFEWQKDIVQWAVKKGRCAIFLDTGLGKTFIQLEWARLLNQNTLIVAPLSVARQTVREAKKINLDIKYVREQPEITGKISITNYEMIEHFDYSKFGAVVLDESSILKSIGGKTRKLITDLCQNIPYKLCCTATPAPNDYIELGNHTEFLGICKMKEMLGTFFINANKEHTLNYGEVVYRRKGSNKNGTEWRLKHHAEQHFFRWLASWAITMTKPSDLGYDDNGFILPELKITPIFIASDYKPTDQLFFTHLEGISDRAQVRASTSADKVNKLKEVVASHEGQWIVWCGLDVESRLASDNLDGAVEVKGSDPIDRKVKSIEDFQDGKIPIMVTKSKIAGFGLNLQSAHNMVFLGLSDSWESFYQCIRREWRYGQKEVVNVYLIMHDVEAEIYQNIMRKDAMAKRLKASLIEQIKDYEKGELGLDVSVGEEYNNSIDFILPDWIGGNNDIRLRLSDMRKTSQSEAKPIKHKDCPEVLQPKMPRNSEAFNETRGDTKYRIPLSQLWSVSSYLQKPVCEGKLHSEVLLSEVCGRGSEGTKQSSVEEWATFPEWIHSNNYARPPLC